MEKEKIIQKLNTVTKLNKLTMFFIVVLYCALAATVITLWASDNYVVEMDENQSFKSDEKVNVSNLIMCKNTATEDSNGQISYKSAYYIYSLVDTKNNEKYENTILNNAVKTNEDYMIYFNQITYKELPATKNRLKYSKVDSSFTYTSDNHDKIKNIGVKTIYGDIIYGKDEKVYRDNYSRDILTLSASEMKKAGYDNPLKDMLEARLVFNQRDTDKQYYFYRFSINVSDLSVAYKIDSQVFLETKDGTVLDLCGIYNYADDDTNFSTYSNTTGAENQVYVSLNPKTFYIKINYYTLNKKCQTAVFKVDYRTLVDEYNN